MARAETVQPIPDRIDKLIELGQENQIITVNEIFKLIPDVRENKVLLDEVILSLFSSGIEIIDDEPDEPLEEESWEPLDEDFLKNIDADNILGLYIKEVSRTPLLTQQEEVELAKRIECREVALKELTGRKLDKGRKIELKEVIEDGWEAQEQLIKANGRLVISVAKKYMGKVGLEFLDLIQNGNIGLIRAIQKFDYRLGHRFSTYATWWVRQAITRDSMDTGRTIRIPFYMGDNIKKMLSARHVLTQQLGREPTTEELAGELNVSVKKIETLIRINDYPLSLDEPTSGSEESVFGDFIKDEGVNVQDEVENNRKREQIEKSLKLISAREAKVLILRFGLKDEKPHTLEEISLKMGVTRERIRQIEEKAKEHLLNRDSNGKLKDLI